MSTDRTSIRPKKRSRRWLWALAAIAVAGAGFVLALLASARLVTGGSGRLVIAYDVLAPVGDPVPLQVKLQSGPLLADVTGETVMFHLPDGRQIPGVTDAQGVASIEAHFDRPGDVRIPLTLPDPFHGTPADTASSPELRAFVRPTNASIVVSDVDHTLADISATKVLQTPNAQTLALPGSAEVLTRLAETHLVVYLTARDDKLLNKTRDWLREQGYPSGPLFGRDIGVDPLSAEAFKSRWLASLKATWPNVTWGFGDRMEDGRAYDAAGIQSFIIHPDSADAGEWPDSARPVMDWATISAQLFGPN